MTIDYAPSADSTILAPSEALSIMAKSAVFVDPSRGETEAPDIKIEQKETPPNTPNEAPAPTEMSKAEAPAATPAAVSENKPAETKAEAAPAAAAPQINWQEVLKQHPSNEILKALGLDESVVDFASKHKKVDPSIAKLVDYWAAKGDVKKYMEALSTDYSKMTDEQAMKHQLHEQLKEQGLEMTSEEFDDYYRLEVTDRYKLDPDMYSEKERKTGLVALKVAAQQARNKLVADQKQYLLDPAPEVQQSEIEQELEAREQAAQQAVTEYLDFMKGAPEVKTLLDKKVLTIGNGEEAFNFSVANPVEMVDPLFDMQKFDQQLRDKDGKWDARKHLLLAAFTQDMDGFLAKYAAHHQEIGKNKAIAPLENATRPGTATSTKTGSEESNLSPAAAMARSGIVVTGG